MNGVAAAVFAVIGAGCTDSAPDRTASPVSTSGPTTSVSTSGPTTSSPVRSSVPPHNDDDVGETRPLTFPGGPVAAPRPGPRPERFLGVTDGGVVVIVDAAAGSSIGLARGSDPRVPQTQESASYTYVRNVTLSLDGRTAYFTYAPEPACGSVEEVPVAGGEAESIGDGTHVTAGPGGHVATSGCGLRIRKGNQVVSTTAAPIQGFLRNAAWSADGRQIAVEFGGPMSEPSVILVFDLVAGDTSASATEIRDPEGLGYGLPAFRNDGRLVVAHPPRGDQPAAAKVLDSASGAVVGSFSYGGAVVDQAYDGTHTWLLVTLADGTLRWFGGGEQGDLGTGYLAADW